MFHRFARAPEYHPLDTKGQCITCHQEGRCAESKALDARNHPDITCNVCHNPHETETSHFLRARPADLCVGCHAEQAALTGGRHNFCSGRGEWPASSRESNDACLACHRPHAREDGSLMRVAPSDFSSDAACVACHSGAAWNALGGHVAMHPRAAVSASTQLPLVSIDSAHTKGMGCKTCHNPHAATDRLLRHEPDEPASSLCIQCHTPMQQILLTAHANISQGHGEQGESCKACHAMHADPTALAGKLLAVAPLPAGLVVAPNEDRTCLACHRPEGRAAPPAIAIHPDVPIFAIGVGNADASLPLFDEMGRESMQGRITCKTCHVPHGQALIPTLLNLRRLFHRKPSNRCV
ncbi:MAG: hypothetical protein IPK83_22700 [Planctomycetes bacterium]|nr:hypothetical protein [Planctomycetota bacterium]